MFVYNVKINGSKVFKIFFFVFIILIICILGVVLFRIFSGAYKASSCMPQNAVSEISAKNYTNVLKTVHENIDNYVGMKIRFTGYIYRVSDLNDNQFVLARDMIISSNSQFLIFLKVRNLQRNMCILLMRVIFRRVVYYKQKY